MACLVAFDKYRHNSAEAGVKFIVCALFASGLMLYGISLLYGTIGTLYFDDMAAGLTGSPLLLAVIGGDEFGMTSLIFYLLVYMVANLAVFGVMNTVVQHDYGKMTFTDYNGFYSTNPKLA